MIRSGNSGFKQGRTKSERARGSQVDQDKDVQGSQLHTRLCAADSDRAPSGKFIYSGTISSMSAGLYAVKRAGIGSGL